MKLKWSTFFAFVAVIILVSTACSAPLIGNIGSTSTPPTDSIASTPNANNATLVPAQQSAFIGGPAVIQGTFSYTNEFYPEEYAYEHAVELIEMTGFVLRDHEWPNPLDSQVLGYVELDADNNRGTYRLQLPVQPAGVLNDVDHNGTPNTGVQIFAVEYAPNWTGGPYYFDDDVYRGWPSYLASVVTDSENQDEVTGGKLIVWAPDDQQEFPTAFGTDGKLFTSDDPVGPIPAGYSIIDLDQQPFAIIRDEIADITLLEPQDVAVKDFSTQTFSDAFNSMFDKIKVEYAFNGIQGKAPDWDALYAEIYPRVQQAQQANDSYAYYLALRDFSLAFKDGHVGLDGGNLSAQYNQENITGGYGFSVRELDDGRVLVVFVGAGSPAANDGMQVGAEVKEFNGDPVSVAIGKVKPFSPQSTDYGLRYEQTVFLTRGKEGDTAEVTYINPGFPIEHTATLTAVQEMDSLFATYLNGYYNLQTADDLPIEYQIRPSGIGYIKINSNSDDLNLAYRLFLRALNTFKNNSVSGIIIDMRLDFGGTALGLSGFFTNEDITMGQLEYYSDTTGQFEPEGDPGRFTPNIEQFQFDRMVLLVDQFCYSACELEAFGFSQLPGIIVAGQFPTAGVEAETARGDFKLPAGVEITIPTGRFILPDGSLFLEGHGVVPSVHIPVDQNSVLSTDDVVLEAAENIALGQ